MQIQRRDILVSVILSIVTCGIYGIYWAVMAGREAMALRDPGDNGVLEIVLLILFPFVGFFLVERKFTEGCQRYGIPHNDNSVLYLVLGLVSLSIVSLALLQNDLNKLVPPAPPAPPAY